MTEVPKPRLAIIEDDGEFMPLLVELLRPHAEQIAVFFDLDEARQSLIVESRAREIDVFLIDLMLPMPTTFSLQPDFNHTNAGLGFHRLLEASSDEPAPVVFLTGATTGNPQLKERIDEYVRGLPGARSIVVKPAPIEDICDAIFEVGAAPGTSS